MASPIHGFQTGGVPGSPIALWYYKADPDITDGVEYNINYETVTRVETTNTHTPATITFLHGSPLVLTGVVAQALVSDLIAFVAGGGVVPVFTVDGLTWSIVTTTDDIPEGSNNLYFTAARVADKATTVYVDTQDGAVLAAAEGYTDSAISTEILDRNTAIGTAISSEVSRADGAYLHITGGTLTGDLLFSLDNSKDIGASGATRPRTLYLGTSALAPLFNAATGFQINGGATTGHVLRGDGTNFVDAQLGYGDLSGAGATGVTITYTDGTDSVAQSVVMSLTKQDGTVGINNAGNTTTTVLYGSIAVYAKTGVAIQYAIDYTSNTAAQMAYAARMRCEAM